MNSYIEISDDSFSKFHVNGYISSETIAPKVEIEIALIDQETNQIMAEPTVVKVLVINVQDSGTANDWIEIAKIENADIIIADETGLWGKDNDAMLNEILAELNANFPTETPYTGYALHGQERASEGEAVITRFPIVRATEVKEFIADDGTIINPYYHVIDVEINISGVVTHVVGARLQCCGDERGYMDSKDPPKRRAIDHEGYVNYLDSLGSVPILYGGDLNSYSPYDVGEIAPSEANLGAAPISMLVNSSYPTASENHSWVDVYRETNPYDKGYTYVDWQYQSRIDYLFVNDFFHDKLINSTVLPFPPDITPPDHFPLVAFFNMNPELADLRPPIKIHNIRGTIINSTSINITWDSNPEVDLTEYIIHKDDLEIDRVTTPNYVDSTLVPGQIYRFRVSAIDTSNNIGAKSILFILNTTFGICRTPGPPVLTATGGINNNTLSWILNDNGGLPVTGYQLYRIYTYPSSGYELIHRYPTGISAGIFPPEQTTFIDTGVAPGRTYRYLITALNELGEGVKSEIAFGTVLTSPTTTTTDGAPTFGFSIIPIAFTLTLITIYRKKRI